MLAAVGVPCARTMRTMLFLSRIVTVEPLDCCAQPSGYLIEKPSAESTRRKTWLSGMSPAAFEFASAWSADGGVDPGAAAVEGVLTAGAGGLVEACFVAPHPGRARAANARSGPRAGTRPVMARPA